MSSPGIPASTPNRLMGAVLLGSNATQANLHLIMPKETALTATSNMQALAGVPIRLISSHSLPKTIQTARRTTSASSAIRILVQCKRGALPTTRTARTLAVGHPPLPRSTMPSIRQLALHLHPIAFPTFKTMSQGTQALPVTRTHVLCAMVPILPRTIIRLSLVEGGELIPQSDGRLTIRTLGPTFGGTKTSPVRAIWSG